MAPHAQSKVLPERNWITLDGGKFLGTLESFVDLGADLMYSDAFISPMKTAVRHKNFVSDFFGYGGMRKRVRFVFLCCCGSVSHLNLFELVYRLESH